MQRRILNVEIEGGKRIAHGIEVDICPFCGEELYDHDAMQKIEAARPVPRRRRRATVRP
jgi:YgiT-type zinc finger domain-containing protein